MLETHLNRKGRARTRISERGGNLRHHPLCILLLARKVTEWRLPAFRHPINVDVQVREG
jgi:hypothetical protein